MVIGAMPMPADTSETARLRWVSNQPVTVAIIGAKIAAIAPPTRRPKMNWNASSEVAWLASARLAASTDRSRQHHRQRPEPVGQRAPDHAAARHRQEADRHRARHAGDRPAGIPRDRLAAAPAAKTSPRSRRSPACRRPRRSPSDSENGPLQISVLALLASRRLGSAKGDMAPDNFLQRPSWPVQELAAGGILSNFGTAGSR